VRLLILLLVTSLAVTSAPLPAPDTLAPEVEDVIARYQSAAELQRKAMLGVQMEMDISGRFTKLQEEGRMRGVRTIEKTGDLTWKTFEFMGDSRVKTELIARFLEQEQKDRAYGAMILTPRDYEFHLGAVIRDKVQTVYQFDVKPRKNIVGRIKGEIWIDGKTGMPLREAGMLVKSPSVWLTNLRFTRDYELRDGISIVKSFRSSTDVRLLGVGRAELDVDFKNFSHIDQAARVPQGTFLAAVVRNSGL
jgi:hypothetical protein